MAESFVLLNNDVKMNCIRYITGLAVGDDNIVLVKKYKETRSGAQLRLKWLWMGQIAKERAGFGIGRDLKGWNRYFKALYMRELLIAQDEDFVEFYKNSDELVAAAPTKNLAKFARAQITNSLQTEWLNVKSMSEYMNLIDQFCIKEWQLVLATPNDLEWAK
ncbi:MAG: hypothetical protein DRQ40_03870 [Gammaproteobacteria bacterium]|nr:MAG: hypothetical protein DRQ40_03870 [Gammaproteobacteria bacterium]